MLEVVHQISIYIHRFHNQDLFQQGWYQIKTTMSWEDGDYGSLVTPARVIQYEASEDVNGVWRIDDTDNSFSTQPLRIRYARQDILLSMMVSFNLPLSKFEHPSTSAVILKFELMYAPVLEKSRYNRNVCMLKSGVSSAPLEFPSDSGADEDAIVGETDKSKHDMLVKELSSLKSYKSLAWLSISQLT
ncbi:GATA transcription factor 25 [Olea europaea subsp. europaea]|uniref:GATA transcription factor 25 n=1 Tax=Olea europaea subsp. europaea TaxID=158383 RepID=A0A8S0V8J7_OLEEU|nr:GATA transcription factor 25 [Olea europaea subsp. europaea]